MRRAVIALTVVLAVVLAGCQGGPAADTPSGVVRTALERVADKDLEGLRELACAGAEEAVLERLGLPVDLGGEILPGLDANTVLDAVNFDTSNLTIAEETIQGDSATVTVRGDIEVSFDVETLRPIVRTLLEAQGAELTDAQLDALLRTLERAGRELPIDQVIGLVREDGAWKLCSVE